MGLVDLAPEERTTAMREENRVLRIIALIQFAGGALGAVMAALMGPSLALQSHVPLARILVWLVPPFALSLAAGALLWRGGTAGEVLSFVNLALQIPVIDTSFISYFFNSGVALRLWLSSDGPGWFLFLGSQFHINFAARTDGVLIGINVIAAGLLALLIYAMPEDTASSKTSQAVAHSS